MSKFQTFKGKLLKEDNEFFIADKDGSGITIEDILDDYVREEIQLIIWSNNEVERMVDEGFKKLKKEEECRKKKRNQK